MSDICRLCASVKSLDVLINIEDPNHSIVTKISQCCQILLSEEDQLPQNACTDCIQSLNLCVSFIEKVLNAQETLKQAILFSVKVENSFQDIIELNSPSSIHENDNLSIITVNETTKDDGTDNLDASSSPKNALGPFDNKKNIIIEEDLMEQKSAEIPKWIVYDTTDNSISLKHSNEIYHVSEIEVMNHEEQEVLNSDDHIEIDQNDITAHQNSCDNEIELTLNENDSNLLESNPEAENQDEGEKEDTQIMEANKMIEYINNHIEKQTTEINTSDLDGEKYIFMNLSDEDKNIDGTISEKALQWLNLLSWEQYPWNCVKCLLEFKNLSEWRAHSTAFHDKTLKYSCADCTKVFPKYSTFLNHVRRRHRTHLKYNCDICYLYFWNLKLLKKHRIQKHPDEEKSNVCKVCNKSFRSSGSLQTHEKSHLPEDEKYIYECDICEKKFGTKPNLLIHKRIHTGIREHVCDNCGKSFFQKVNLDKHMLTHMPARLFSCDICGKSFKTQIRLNNHATVHSGLKPYQCDVCGRQFRERGTLREHNRIHTGAMPFTCEFCGKKFRFKGILTTHRRQHTGERPYSCLDCNHHFTNWPNFNKHMKRRHGINTSVSVRKPQAIPPSGMPPRSKLNHVVPTVHNTLALKDDLIEIGDENSNAEQQIDTTVMEGSPQQIIVATDIPQDATGIAIEEHDQQTSHITLSTIPTTEIQQIINNTESEEIQQFQPIISYLSNGIPVSWGTSFYSIQTVDDEILENTNIQS